MITLYFMHVILRESARAYNDVFFFAYLQLSCMFQDGMYACGHTHVHTNILTHIHACSGIRAYMHAYVYEYITPAAARRPNRPNALAHTQEQIRKLTHQVKQRDNEIVILVNMINEAKKGGAVLSGVNMGGAGAGNEGRSVSAGPGSLVGGGLGGDGGKGGGAGAGGTVAPLVDPEILKDRAKAFEVFRGTYHKNEAIESNKAALKGKYDEAKSVGEAVNTARSRISDIKAKIEQLRVERAMRGEGGEEAEADPEEEALKAQIDGNKTEYKDKFNRLRQLKAEIEHIQGIMEKQRTGLQKDFENWYNLMVRQHKSALKEAAGGVGGGGGADAGGGKSPLKGAVTGAGHGSGGGAGKRELGEGQISTGNKEADADIGEYDAQCLSEIYETNEADAGIGVHVLTPLVCSASRLPHFRAYRCLAAHGFHLPCLCVLFSSWLSLCI